MDGVVDLGSFIGNYNISPIIDAVQEFKVQSHNDLSEFGQAPGGIVNVVTKSGTNAYHVQRWEFLRNEKFDARQLLCLHKRTQSAKAKPVRRFRRRPGVDSETL